MVFYILLTFVSICSLTNGLWHSDNLKEEELRTYWVTDH